MTAADYAAQVKADLGDSWLPHIYAQRIRSKRTRSYSFTGLKPRRPVEIQHTLLGVELKAGRQRWLCPDLATARYLAVFARAGCEQVAVPYDITSISRIADELESSWHRMLLLVDHRAAGTTEAFRARVARILIDNIRSEIAKLGAGTSIPEFKKSTSQRS
jgi:hypothetical protein